MEKENAIEFYRFGEAADGRTIVGKWVLFRDKKLNIRGFWAFKLITRTSAGIGEDDKGKTVHFREEVPSKSELEETFIVPEAPAESAAKVEVPWRDCLKAQQQWREFMRLGVAREKAIDEMKRLFPVSGASAYAGF